MAINHYTSKIFTQNQQNLFDHSWIGITISNSASKKIYSLMKKDNTMLGLQINIKESGCAGLTYIINKMTQINNDEKQIIFQHNKAKIYIPLKKMPFLDGSSIDYIKEGLNYLFKIHNPNAKNLCGCGNSFNLK